MCHLASILCFLVASGSVCPTFHHENRLEAFVKKNIQILDPAESNSQGRLWLLEGNGAGGGGGVGVRVCGCVCSMSAERWKEGSRVCSSEIGHIKVFCID